MFNKIVYSIFRILFKIIIRTEVKGLENIPEGAFVLACNHVSNYDPFLLSLNIGNKKIRFMAKKELFKFKISSWFFTKLGSFPVDRNSNDLKAVKTGLSILKNGEVLGIFPQGTRCKSIDVKSVKPGYVLFADRCNVPIVPVGINGNYKFMSKMTVTYGEPYYIQKNSKSLTPEELQNVSFEVMEKIKCLAENL